ncbi:pentapeptide repeat-containing protein [Streptococcus oralis]|uniref:pentapeptide repeat-containing protein n=1 Tax=Streptococcus oralis TaxID=1303 RepID=UPI002284BD6A|nr:pentapeptide repeat-containing protein [Streptococcus oralis]MCY7062386.1 pentapeptide repeat-containing protein [Streptococcus oralis]
MVEKDGIIIKDGHITLNSGEELSIDKMRDGARKVTLISNRHFKNTNIKGIENFRVVFENCIFENVFFENCDLREISFKNHTVIRNCTFKRCNLNGTLFYDSHIISSTFLSCQMKRPLLENVSEMRDCLFKKCRMHDIFFPLPEFQSNKIIGKLSECTFGSKTKKVEKLYADLSEAHLSFVGFTRCDLTETICPEDPDILYINNLSERSKKAQKKIATIQDARKRRALSIYTESWKNEKYVDYLLSRKDYKWAWDDYFEDVSRCLGLEWK